ncbi:MAG: signal recognition particle protein, partial [Planctomycetota bacterium]
GRILGMGDVLTLVEQARRKVDQEEMAKQEARLRKGEFTLDDFRKLMDQTRRLGSMSKLLGMIPGMGQMKEMMGDADAEQEMSRFRGIIDSMTPEERRNPSKVVDQSRRRRIAEGAGVEAHEVNALVKQFDGMADMMKKMSGMGMRGRMKAMQDLTQSAVANPGGKLSKQKKGTGKRLSPKERAKIKRQKEKEARRRKRQAKRD